LTNHSWSVVGEQLARTKGRRAVLRHISAAAQVVRAATRRRAVLCCAHARRGWTRVTRRAAWCAWPARTSAWPDPRALRLALDAAETYERLGSPEGELTLAQASSTCGGAQSQRRLQPLQGGARLSPADHAGGAAHLRNRDPTDEWTWTTAALPYAQTRRRLRGRESYWPEDIVRRRLPAVHAGWRSASARNWTNCVD